MVQIYSAAVCPFAQRVRAFLRHLGEDFEVHEIDLSERDPDFLKISPTGKVPLLLDGELKLYESQVILQYLAEKHAWGNAFSPRMGLRARQRLAMKQWDDSLMPPFYESLMGELDLDDETRGRMLEELDELAATVSETEPESLLGFTCAPFWVRMDWLREHSEIPALFEEKPDLVEWLRRTAEIEAVRETLPDKDWMVSRYEERYVSD